MTPHPDQMSIESQGDHEYVARLSRGDETAETWISVTPEVLAELDVDPEDEEALVRRAVDLVARHGPLADLPEIITLEDVIAAYPDGSHGLGGS